jgi:two-component system sensor histidine kinase YesM
MLGIIIFVNIFLVGAVSIFGMNIVMKANNNILYQSIANSLSYSASDIEDILDNTLTLSNIIIADGVIQRQLSIIQDSDNLILRSNAYKSLYTTIQSYFTEFKKNGLNYILLYNEHFTTNTYISESNKVPDTITTKLIDNAIIKDGAPSWSTEYIDDYGLFLSRAIRKIENLNLDTIGVLNINVSLDKIIEDGTKFSTRYDTTYYLLYDKDRLVYHSSDLSVEDASYIQNQQITDYGIITLEKKKYFLVKEAFPNFGWDYICLVSYDKIYNSTLLSYTLYLLIILASIGLSIFLSSVFIHKIIKHFDNLMLKMRSFRGQVSEQIDVGYDYSERGDEFGVLHRQFDSMASEIQHLIQVNYINELLVKDAKFKALETQINPHFLYNVLESVNWRAKSIGEKDISLMVESLGWLLRSTLSEQDDAFTLRKELDLVNCYMAIQLLRFDEQLVFHVDIEDALLSAKIPKLTLQPLIENAIHYGLERNTETCYINLYGKVQNNILYLSVSNSGTQFEEDLITKLSSKKITPYGLGIGLLNIDSRLKISFGESYGLNFINKPDTAIAQIIIPFEPIDQ